MGGPAPRAGRAPRHGHHRARGRGRDFDSDECAGDQGARHHHRPGGSAPPRTRGPPRHHRHRLAEEGDPFAALESFGEAARLEAANPERLALHRYRFEVTQAHATQLAHTFSATSTVTSACFSPDGQRLLTAGAEGTNGLARVWDTFTGTPITSLHVPAGPVRWAGFTRDGAHLITRAEKGAVQLWRADTGAAAGGPWPVPPPMLGNRLLTARDGLVWSLALHGTGRWLALPGRNEVVLQPLAADDPVRPVFSTPKSVNQVFFSPDDLQVVALLEGGGAEIHDSATGELVLVAGRHQARARQ